MSKGRPGGNPNITDHAYSKQHQWSQSCTVSKSLKMPPLMAQALKDGQLPDWQEICRQAIAANLPPQTSLSLGWNPKQQEKQTDT